MCDDESLLRLCRHFAAKQNCFVVVKKNAVILYRKMGNVNTIAVRKRTINAMLCYLKEMDKAYKIKF